jgi:hypothetical protein
MPITPPDGKPMSAHLRVQAANGTSFPTTVRATFAWVLLGNETWAAPIQEEVEWPAGSPFREWVVRGGPKWGPGVLVDVVVELVAGSGPTVLLRAPDQLIHKSQ